MQQEKMYFDIGVRPTRKWIKTAMAHAKNADERKSIFSMSRDTPKAKKSEE